MDKPLEPLHRSIVGARLVLALLSLSSPCRLALPFSSPQNLFGRAEECRRLDADSCPRRASLHTRLVVVTRAQVALDCQFLAHLTKSIYRLMDIQMPGH